MRSLLSLLAVALVALPLSLAQRNAKIPNPDPEVERKTFKVADGFEVNLFAADPLLAKPIQMNWDAQGRLWLACSETYPQIKPGKKADDKIIILEDTKGTGKADKVSVYARGLLIPTGLEPGDGGVYVANSTDLLHFSDPKNTGKATKKRVVLSGFGTEDTHHMLHTLRWGHDGNMYLNQSVYIHSHIETPHGVRRMRGGGIWQFRPDSLKLETYVLGFWNSWGHHFDRWGQSFITDGAGGQGVFHGIPGMATDPAPPGYSRLIKGLNPGHPKYCGLEIVSGRHLPDDWQGNLLTNDFRAHRVCRFALTPSGAGYISKQMPDVIKATHPAFRPIDVKMGPDGAIYVADWYNPIIQHGEVDFRDPRRDVTRGRIWRITAKKRPLVKKPKLVDAKNAELLDHLKAPEGWTRHFARRVMQERGSKKMLPDLKAWVAKLDAKEAKNEPHLLEALWTYQALAVVEPGLLSTLLNARDYRVRAAAVRVLSAWHAKVKNSLELLEARIADENAQVRLEAVRALGLVNTARAAEVALKALDRPVDQYVDYALWLTVRELEPKWLPALQAGKFDHGNNVRRLTFALQAVGSAKVINPLTALVKGGKLTGEAEVGVLSLLSAVGGAGEQRLVFDKMLKEKTPARQGRLLKALLETTTQRGTKPTGDLKGLVSLLDASDAVRIPAARLAGAWGVEGARAKLTTLAKDAKARSLVRQAAIDGLTSLGGAASKTTLGELADASGEMQRPALTALASLDLEMAAKKAVTLLGSLKSGDGAAQVFEAFLQRKNGATILAKALSGKKLSEDVARAGARAARIAGRPVPSLVEAINKAGGLTGKPRKLSAKEVKALAGDVLKKGDATRGEAIFRRADQLCLTCHAVGGAGGQVGPDLSSIGATAQVDYLIDSLLEPSKAIKENYHSLLVTTRKGQQYTGIKVRQTKTALILRTDQDKELSIPLKDIEEQTPSKSSLMPEGLTDNLTMQELTDLTAFLSQLGKGDRWSVGKSRVARRYQTLQPSGEWTPAYSTVAGTLPLDGLPGLVKDKQKTTLRLQIEAAKAAKVRVKMLKSDGIALHLDGEPVESKDTVELDLKQGVHTLTLTVTRLKRTDGVRLEIEDSADAGVRFVGGK